MSIIAATTVSSQYRYPLAPRPASADGAFGLALNNASAKVAGAPAMSSAVQTITSPDGTVWTKTDMAAALTSDDKRILGWPGSDPATNMLAAMVASDRVDGSLQGRMTSDYITGNRSKNIAGLLDRQPAEVMTSDRVKAMLQRLTSGFTAIG